MIVCMAGGRRQRSTPPAVAPEVAALAEVEAGPELLARLLAMPEPALTGYESVLYLRAWRRVANFAEGHLIESVAGVMVRQDPSFGLVPDPDDPDPGRRFDAVASAEVRPPWWCRGPRPTACVSSPPT